MKFRIFVRIRIGVICLFLGATACSHSEGKKSQPNQTPGDPPIYVINGRVITGDTASTMIPRLKQKYIDALHVLPGGKAKLLYGKKAKGGAIVYQISNEKEAFHDLRPVATSDSSQNKSTKVYNFADQQPVLKGGLKKLQQKLTYPKECMQAGVKGRVFVEVIVNKKGLPVNPKVVKGLGHGCDKEAIRVAKTARFIPGKIDGKAVKVKYLLQVVFPPGK